MCPESNLNLVASQHWIRSPSNLALMNEARSFSIQVDTRTLPPGHHYGEVCAYDTSKSAAGPLFRVPVTAIIPTLANDQTYLQYDGLTFTAGQVCSLLLSNFKDFFSYPILSSSLGSMLISRLNRDFLQSSLSHALMGYIYVCLFSKRKTGSTVLCSCASRCHMGRSTTYCTSIHWISSLCSPPSAACAPHAIPRAFSQRQSCARKRGRLARGNEG